MQIEQTKNEAKAYATPTIAAARAVADFVARAYECSDHARAPLVSVYSFGKRAHGVQFTHDDGYITFLLDPKLSVHNA